MATEMLTKKVLVLNVDEGVDEKGEPIVKKYNYANVMSTATPQGFFDAAQALATLYDGTLTTADVVATSALRA